MNRVAALGFALLGLVVSGATAGQQAGSVGRGHGISVPGPRTNPYPGSTLFLNYDGTAENGYCWQFGGVVPPYYGAFAECFEGYGRLYGMELLLTGIGSPCGELDGYVWADAGGMPGIVMYMIPNANPCPVVTWPNISAHDFPIDLPGERGLPVSGRFWLGFWEHQSAGGDCGYFVAADLDGQPFKCGCPFTNIAAGIGYPTGWNDVNVIPGWGPTSGLGIGAWMIGGVGKVCYSDSITVRTGMVGGQPGSCPGLDDNFRYYAPNGSCGEPILPRPFNYADFDAACAGPQAYVVDPYLPAWPVNLPDDPDARWINWNNDWGACYGYPDESVLYCGSFTVASPSVHPIAETVKVSWAVDDFLGDPIAGGSNLDGVYINGASLGSAFRGAQYPEKTAVAHNVWLRPGVNHIQVYQRDGHACVVSGLMLSAQIDLTSQICPVQAWGWNQYGQCNVPPPNTEFVAVSAGGGHSLGLKSDGTIAAWGYNGYGQCNVPPPNAGFIAVSAGRDHSLGLKIDGTIVAWGNNSSGQCNVPSSNADFTAIAGGYAHSLGLKSDGSIMAWGSNSDGQLNVPPPNTGFVAISAGSYHSLGLKSDRTIVTWGSNTYGQRNVPTPNADFVAIAAGHYHSLGLKFDGSIRAWGSNSYGQCNLPAPNADFVSIAAGYFHSLGLKNSGTIAAWGYNGWGQCDVPAPNIGFTAVAGGHQHSLALGCPEFAAGVEGPAPQVASGGGPLRILTVTPNPITTSAEISFETRESGPVRMRVYDVGGRQVVSSTLGSFAPGRHQVRWEARDEAGLRLPSGVYFLRAQGSAGEPSAARVLLLR